ncbi:hypothetical protein [Echinicola strongylocentroti]|nr:hypothetical protein [Echinicola strongylocentroti]
MNREKSITFTIFVCFGLSVGLLILQLIKFDGISNDGLMTSSSFIAFCLLSVGLGILGAVRIKNQKA